MLRDRLHIALQIVGLGLMLLFGAVLVAGFLQAEKSGAAARATITKLGAVIDGLNALINAGSKTIGNVNETVSMWRGASREEELAAAAQIRSVASFQKQAADALASVQALVAHTDNSLNSPAGTFASLDADLVNIGMVGRTLNQRLLDLQQPEEDFGVAMASVAKEVPPTAANLRRASANLNHTSRDFADMADSGDRIVHHFERVITKPTSAVKAGLGYAAHWMAWVLGSAI